MSQLPFGRPSLLGGFGIRETRLPDGRLVRMPVSAGEAVETLRGLLGAEALGPSSSAAELGIRSQLASLTPGSARLQGQASDFLPAPFFQAETGPRTAPAFASNVALQAAPNFDNPHREEDPTRIAQPLVTARPPGDPTLGHGQRSGSSRLQSPQTPPHRVERGGLSARHESNGDSRAVSTGSGDPGGVSYGRHQLSTDAGTAATFVASPEFERWRSEFQGLQPGTEAFGRQWRAVTERDGGAFDQAQGAFIDRTHYQPAHRTVERQTGYRLDDASDAVQNYAYSMTVQHGAAGRLIAEAVESVDLEHGRADQDYQAALINAMADRREAYVAGLRDRELARARQARTPAVAQLHRGQANTYNNIIRGRFVTERADALRMLEETSVPGAPPQAPAQVRVPPRETIPGPAQPGVFLGGGGGW